MSGLYTNGLNRAVLPLTGNETAAFDTNLTQGRYPESEAISVAQLATALSSNPSWVTGRFYGLPDGTTPVAVLTVTGTLYAYPVVIPSVVTIKTLNISVTTGQTGGAAHFGIYADNGAGYPGTLVYDSGSVTGLTSTAVVTNTLSSTLTLNPGIYWIATTFTASGTFPSVAGITANYSVATVAQLGSDTAAHALATSGQAATGISVAFTYGALPTTFTSGATLTLNAATPLLAVGV